MEIENLYKILGTRSNIGQKRIKEKYIAKIKEFPPETHPEEFEEIRRAYETLKDVDKREQYDMLRKYGNKLEKLMNNLMSSTSDGNLETADKLMDFILEIDPGNVKVKLTRAKLILHMGELEKFHDVMDEVVETVDVQEKEYIIFTKFMLLHSEGYYDEAFAELEKGKEYIRDMKLYHRCRAIGFMSLSNFQEAWEEFEIAFPSINSLTIEDLDVLPHWLITGIELEKWGELSKIQNYFQKLAKTIKDKEEQDEIKERLLEEAEGYVDVTRFREADVFMQLASKIYKNDKYIKERRKEIQTIAKIEMELDRSSKDKELIPYVHIKILDSFFSKYADSEEYAEFLNDYPHDMMRELEWMKEDIAYGVLRVKKKYPSLYREFKQELTKLFDESTEGLNREQRRRLR